VAEEPGLTRPRFIAATAALVAVAVTVYAPALGGWFQLDDFSWFAAVRGRTLVEALFSHVDTRSWRPLAEALQYWTLDRTVGMAALPAHLLSLSVYATAVVLVVRLARVLGASHRQALASGALFALHDAHVMATCWNATLNQPAFVALAALHLISVKRIFDAGRASALRWAAAVATALVAALVHESAVLLPVADALVAIGVAPRRARRRALALVAALGVALGAFCAWRLHVAARFSDGPYRFTVGGETLSALGWYVDLALCPNVRPFPGRPALDVLLATALIAFAARAWRRGDRLPALGLSLFAVLLAPALTVPRHLSDYYLTIPSVGLALAGGALVEAGLAHPRRAVTVASALVASAWLVAMGLTARDRAASVASNGRVLRPAVTTVIAARRAIGPGRLLRLGRVAPAVADELSRAPTPFDHLGLGPVCVEPRCPPRSATDVPLRAE